MWKLGHKQQFRYDMPENFPQEKFSHTSPPVDNISGKIFLGALFNSTVPLEAGAPPNSRCFLRPCATVMFCARFNISKPIIIRSSHKKNEYKQVWSLLQYRELGNTEKYTKANENMKNN